MLRRARRWTGGYCIVDISDESVEFSCVWSDLLAASCGKSCGKVNLPLRCVNELRFE